MAPSPWLLVDSLAPLKSRVSPPTLLKVNFLCDLSTGHRSTAVDPREKMMGTVDRVLGGKDGQQQGRPEARPSCFWHTLRGLQHSPCHQWSLTAGNDKASFALWSEPCGSGSGLWGSDQRKQAGLVIGFHSPSSKKWHLEGREREAEMRYRNQIQVTGRGGI